MMVSFVSFLTHFSPKDGSLWRLTKKKSNYKTSNLPIKNLNGRCVITDTNKAELFKVHLSNTFKPHLDILSHTNKNPIEEYLRSPL